MASKYWIKLSIEILNDRRIHNMSDKSFRKYIYGLFDNPANLHYDTSPAKLGWLLVRRKRMKELFEKEPTPHRCKFCGSTENLEIDHIKPLSRGGSNDLVNLQILCKPCNRKKWAHYDGK